MNCCKNLPKRVVGRCWTETRDQRGVNGRNQNHTQKQPSSNRDKCQALGAYTPVKTLQTNTEKHPQGIKHKRPLKRTQHVKTVNCPDTPDCPVATGLFGGPLSDCPV